MSLLDLCASLEATKFAITIAESEWLFPTIETIHVIALTLVVGSIAMLDLRMLGVTTRKLGVAELSAEVLPWTWGAFIVAAITGSLMFTSAATKYYANIPFRMKMVLLVCAGLNMMIFNATALRRVGDWNMAVPTPRAARIAAALSLLFWISIVFAGRWIGFVK